MSEKPLLVPEFEVTNLQKTIEIYSNVFGFKIGYDRPEEDFAYMERGSIHIMLEKATGAGRRFHNADLEYPFGRGINFQIEVDNVDEIYKRAQNCTDLKIHIPIEERWYRMNDIELGNRQFVVLDPDGYMLRFFTDIGERVVEK